MKTVKAVEKVKLAMKLPVIKDLHQVSETFFNTP